MLKARVLVPLVCVGVTAFATNPSEQDHAQKISQSMVSSVSNQGTETAFSRFASAAAASFSNSLVDYKSYGVFSTATLKGAEETTSIGAFGYIHIPKRKQ